MLGPGCLRDYDRALLAQQPSEGDLRRRRAAAAGDLAERSVGQHAAGPERRISRDRDLMLAAPGDEVPFGATPAKVIEHLIGRNGAAALQSLPFRHVRAVEIADPVMADLTVALEPLKALQGLGERHRAAPMQQVKIDPVGGEPLEAALAGGDDTGA